MVKSLAYRSVVQLARIHGLGPWGCGFESRRSELFSHKELELTKEDKTKTRAANKKLMYCEHILSERITKIFSNGILLTRKITSLVVLPYLNPY